MTLRHLLRNAPTYISITISYLLGDSYRRAWGDFLGTTKEDGTNADQRSDAQNIYRGIIQHGGLSKSDRESADWRCFTIGTDKPVTPHTNATHGMWTGGGRGAGSLQGNVMLNFAEHEGHAARYDTHNAWWFINGKWTTIDPAELMFVGHALTESEFNKMFPNLPALPA